MSKLDQILQEFVDETPTGEDDFPTGVYLGDRGDAKKAIKDLMLELIGGDESYGDAANQEPSWAKGVPHRNSWRVELRQKIEAL